MSRIQLRVYVEPAEVECFLRIKRKDGDYEKLSAIVDTGAQISLLPIYLLDVIDYPLDKTSQIQIDQAGIANQQFGATETMISLFLEDVFGAHTSEITVTAWFAPTSTALIGFGGILERAVFHLDMPQLSGYLEL